MYFEKLELLEDIFLSQPENEEEEINCFACNKPVNESYQVIADVINSDGKIETQFLMLCDKCYQLHMKEGE
jgi:hypothetical protein